jgi:hypothetical protein
MHRAIARSLLTTAWLVFALPTLHAQVVPAYNQTNAYLLNPSENKEDRTVRTGTNPSSASSNLSVSGDWGSMSSFGFADLASGTLRSRTTANITQPESNAYVQSNAYFADGFRTANPNGSPFNWGPSASGRFTLDLSGSIASAPSLQTMNAGAFVILSILQPGTLDPDGRLAGVPEVLNYYYWQLGNSSLPLTACDYVGNCTPLVPTAYFASFPQRIVQDITPGSDFDWLLLIGSYGQPGNATGFFDLDFSNTLTATYEGPAGTTTFSQSGVFAGTTPLVSTVPEPATVAMVAAGLLGVLGARRRRGAAVRGGEVTEGR